MHENQANKKLLYEKELDEEAIKIAAAKEASYQQALDNEAIALPEDFPEILPSFTF